MGCVWCGVCVWSVFGVGELCVGVCVKVRVLH